MPIKRKTGRPRPVLDFIAGDLFAGTRLMGVMAWPHDPDRRREFDVTHGSLAMGMADAVMGAVPPAMLETVIEAAVEECGMDLSALPPEFRGIVAAKLREEGGGLVREGAETGLFHPSGGYIGVALAPGLATLNAEMDRAATGGAAAAGFILNLAAVLARFHPDMSASVNRAVRVVEAAKKATPSLRWRADARLKEDWVRWRAVAPLWGAYLAFEAATIEDAARRGAVLTANEVLYRIALPNNLARIVAYARWLHRFAVSHTPAGAVAPLIADAEAVVIRPDGPEEALPFRPLEGWALAAARDYAAPKAGWR